MQCAVICELLRLAYCYNNWQVQSVQCVRLGKHLELGGLAYLLCTKYGAAIAESWMSLVRGNTLGGS